MLLNKLSTLCRAIGVAQPVITKLAVNCGYQLSPARLISSTYFSCKTHCLKLSSPAIPKYSLNKSVTQSVRNYFGVNKGIVLNNSNCLLPAVSTLNLQQIRTYKAKVKLKLRCKGCYFEKRLGRWYVECTLKPRHKQMQKIHRKYLYREDYSKGNIRLAAHWGWRKQRFYWKGDQIAKDLYKPLIDYKTSTVNFPH